MILFSRQLCELYFRILDSFFALCNSKTIITVCIIKVKRLISIDLT